MRGKTVVNRPEGEGQPRKRWITAPIALRITGYGSRETLRKAARYKGKFDFRKHPGTGELEYDLDGCIAYTGKTEADFADILGDLVSTAAAEPS